MPARFLNPSETSQVSLPVPRTPADLPSRPPGTGIDWRALRLAASSCCCPAGPAVVAVMPPGRGRAHETDLLLCMHHYRASQHALAAAGATVLDIRGQLIRPGTPKGVTADAR
jgi:hypothetical protein